MLVLRNPFAAAFSVLSVLITVSCTSSQAVDKAKVESDSLTTVAVAKATSETLSRELALSGEFRPFQVVEVHSKVAGYVKKIFVDVGDRVKAGQLLATLEIPEMQDELAQAAAEGRRTTAEVARAKGDLERAEANRALVDLSYSRLASVTKTEPGLIAQQEIDEALARKRAAEAQVAAAKAALAASEQQIQITQASGRRTQTMSEYSQIRAPFSGMITKRYADTGAMIQAGTASQSQAMPVVRLSQMDRLRMVVPVPESAVALIRVGKPVSIRVNSLGKTFNGRISRFTGDVQLSTRTMDVEVDVPNPSGVLKPGMYADVILTLEKHENALTVPVQAVSTRDGKRYVLAVRQGVLEERRIQAGIETAARIEALSGLAPGDLVVIGNRSQLKAGQNVQAKLME